MARGALQPQEEKLSGRGASRRDGLRCLMMLGTVALGGVSAPCLCTDSSVLDDRLG